MSRNSTTQRDAALPSDQEVRELLMAEGLTLLSQTGLSVGLHQLSLEDLASRAGVPPESVHHLWHTRDAFLAELLIQLVEPNEYQGAAFDPETIRVSRAVVEANQARLADPVSRDLVMLEAIRVGARQNFEYISNSIEWRTFTALLISLPAFEDPHRGNVLEAIQKAEDRFIDRMTEFYEEMLLIFRARPRRGITIRQIAAAGAGVVEGLAARAHVTREFVGTPLRLPSLDNDQAEWHLAAVGFAAIMFGMIEFLD